MWCWRRMEISWTDHVINEEVLFRVKEQRNILHEISQREANWIGHILRRNILLQRVVEGKIKRGIEVTGQRGRRRGMLMDELKERRGYCHLKEKALDRTMWGARSGRGFERVVKQTTKWMITLRGPLGELRFLGLRTTTFNRHRRRWHCVQACHFGTVSIWVTSWGSVYLCTVSHDSDDEHFYSRRWGSANCATFLLQLHRSAVRWTGRTVMCM